MITGVFLWRNQELKMQYSIEFFRAEYQKQQKLEQIVNSRILKRPKTKKWQVVASFIILPFLLFLLEFAVFASKMMLAIKIIFTILVVRGLSRKFLWQGNFWEDFLYPIEIFLIARKTFVEAENGGDFAPPLSFIL